MSIRTKAFFIIVGIFTKVVAQEYTVVPELSSIKFEVTHMGFLTVEGTFTDFEGKLNYDSLNISTFSASAILMVNSIDTENESRDNTIKSEGYLDATSFPHISFSSNELQFTDGSYLISGKLRIRDKEKIVTIKGQFEGSGNDQITIIGETEILRSAFALDFGPMDGLISDSVKVLLEIVAQE